MQKEIKFRVWDKILKRWIAVLELDENKTLPNASGYDLVYQQFTGLKDDNNTDIYEGDIIRYKFSLDGLLQTGEVKFSQGCFGVDKYLLWDLDYTEVVGNIFENPELPK